MLACRIAAMLLGNFYCPSEFSYYHSVFARTIHTGSDCYLYYPSAFSITSQHILLPLSIFYYPSAYSTTLSIFYYPSAYSTTPQHILLLLSIFYYPSTYSTTPQHILLPLSFCPSLAELQQCKGMEAGNHGITNLTFSRSAEAVSCFLQ